MNDSQHIMNAFTYVIFGEIVKGRITWRTCDRPNTILFWHRDAVECCRTQVQQWTPTNNRTGNDTEADQHCPATWDGFTCWARAPHGEVINQDCPAFFPHVTDGGRITELLFFLKLGSILGQRRRRWPSFSHVGSYRDLVARIIPKVETRFTKKISYLTLTVRGSILDVRFWRPKSNPAL